MRWFLLLIIGGVASAAPVGSRARLVPDPGPADPEAPPIKTLWLDVGAGWRAVAKVRDATPDGSAYVTSEGELVRAGVVIDHAVLPGFSVGDDGAVAYTRCEQPPVTDVWLWDGQTRRQITHDGRSDRPTLLPDGRLLWVSGAGGVAGFVLDGRRLTNPGRFEVPVPARPSATRVVAGAVEFDAGDGWWRLDLGSGRAAPK